MTHQENQHSNNVKKPFAKYGNQTKYAISHSKDYCAKNWPDWFNLDITIRNSESIAVFKSRFLSFIRPIANNVYNIFDPIGLKLLSRLRLGFSNLNEHRFRHNFQDCMNPLCSCSLDIEDTSHYLLHCHHFSQHRIDLMNSVNSILILYRIIIKKMFFYLGTQVQMEIQTNSF